MDKFNDEEFQRKYLKIKKKLVINKNSVEFPKVFILGGQPGAGKSTLTSRIEESMGKNIIAINGDDFRSSHPNYDNLIKTYGDDSVLYTQKFSNAVTEKLIEDLGNEKYNLIVEGTLRTTEAPLKTARKRGIKTVLVYDPLTNGGYFDTTTDFDYKMDTVSVENLKKIGL